MSNRRDFLRTSGAAALACGLSAFPRGRPARANRPPKRLLVYTRSAGFQHDVVKLGKNGEPSLVDRVWTELAARHNFEVECTKDGRVFIPETIDRFDAFFFYTTEDLMAESKEDGSPPMPKEGKKLLLDAVANGKGFIGSHCAADTFHSDPRGSVSNLQDKVDPYIQMVGGEFISHGSQQTATMHVVDPNFPKGPKDDFSLREEWYSFKNFQNDLHVILVNETKGMKDWQYEREPFPATWARMHGKGRVFYTSMGHRDDVWTNPLFQDLLLGAASWVFGEADVDVTPNLERVTPKANALPKEPPPAPKKDK
jgi:type 1 glutamine amidotransferase